MLTDDPKKLATALEQLESERQWRVDAKVEAGEAIRVLLGGVVVRADDDASAVESVKARKLAELREAGERREIYFDDPVLINTGVPRPKPGADHKNNCHHYNKDNSQYADNATPEIQANGSCVSRVPDAPPRRIVVQIECREGSPGVIAEGTYTISDGCVHVFDARGREIGSAALGPQDDAAVAARKILRDKSQPGFYRPIYH